MAEAGAKDSEEEQHHAACGDEAEDGEGEDHGQVIVRRSGRERGALVVIGLLKLRW